MRITAHTIEATIFRKHIRDRDMLARIGGNEFAVLLQDCPINVAEKIANFMRKDVDDFTFVYKQHSFNIGISAGCLYSCRRTL